MTPLEGRGDSTGRNGVTPVPSQAAEVVGIHNSVFKCILVF